MGSRVGREPYRTGLTVSRQWLRVAVLLLLCLSALSCTGGQGGQESPEPQSNEAAGAPGGSPDPQPGEAVGAPGAPGGGGNEAQAVGAPIKIPSFQQKNAAIADVLGSIEDQFKEECGNDELCVKLVVEPSDADPASCLFKGTDPPEGTTVKRDRTVRLLCTPIAQPEETQPAPEETAPADSQPTPSSS